MLLEPFGEKEQDSDAGRGLWMLLREMSLRPWDEVEPDLPALPLPA